MSFARLLVFIAAWAGLLETSALAAAATASREQWIVSAHAADAIGDALMSAAERAEAEVDLLRRKVGEAGQKPALRAGETGTTTRPAVSAESQAAYRAMNDHVTAEVRRRGAGHAGPSLNNLSDGQLFSEMAALQSYNLRTFRHLEQLREQAGELRRELESTGRWQGDVTTRPAIDGPGEILRAALAALDRPQRSQRWAEARTKLRNAIAASRSQQLRASAPDPSSPQGSPPARAGVVDDPRWQPYYYGPADGYSGWAFDDGTIFEDAFNFRGGGGVYQRYDTRVNADFDTRTQGQSDRRVNVNSDRRLNVHHDPRENF